MSDYEDVHGEELASEIDDAGENLTQQRMGEGDPVPVDVVQEEDEADELGGTLDRP
ncbi:MAG: hypothetical protein H0V40_00255 [Actinobacteria bacterium]|nr:hypothetical protein [Actinomycetota bacterium]